MRERPRLSMFGLAIDCGDRRRNAPASRMNPDLGGSRPSRSEDRSLAAGCHIEPHQAEMLLPRLLGAIRSGVGHLSSTAPLSTVFVDHA